MKLKSKATPGTVDASYWECPHCKHIYSSYDLLIEQQEGEPFECVCGMTICTKEVEK